MISAVIAKQEATAAVLASIRHWEQENAAVLKEAENCILDAARKGRFECVYRPSRDVRDVDAYKLSLLIQDKGYSVSSSQMGDYMIISWELKDSAEYAEYAEDEGDEGDEGE